VALAWIWRVTARVSNAGDTYGRDVESVALDLEGSDLGAVLDALDSFADGEVAALPGAGNSFRCDISLRRGYRKQPPESTEPYAPGVSLHQDFPVGLSVRAGSGGGNAVEFQKETVQAVLRSFRVVATSLAAGQYGEGQESSQELEPPWEGQLLRDRNTGRVLERNDAVLQFRVGQKVQLGTGRKGRRVETWVVVSVEDDGDTVLLEST
jgi:hypothetical protein